MEETKFGFIDDESERRVEFYLPDIGADDKPAPACLRLSPSAMDRYPAFFTGLPKIVTVDTADQSAGPRRSLSCCPGMVLQCNPASGDCQFWSLAQSLNTYQGNRHPELKTRLAFFGLELGKLVAMDLRRLAYSAFLVPHPDLDVHLERWKECASDPSLKGSYDHARFLSGKRIDTLTPGDRMQLFRILMRPQETWGDETSLILLERLLAVRVDVIYKGALQVRDPGHEEEPLVFVAMHLSMQHYESVAILDPATQTETSAWSKHELPADLVAMHRAHCSRASKPWVQMSDDWLKGSPSAVSEEAGTCDKLLQHVVFYCLPILQEKPDAAAVEDVDLGFCAYDRSSVTDMDSPCADGLQKSVYSDYRAGAGLPERTVVADGGWMDASTPHLSCTMLQCGLSVNRSKYFKRATKTQRLDEDSDKDNIRAAFAGSKSKTILQGAAPIHLF